MPRHLRSSGRGLEKLGKAIVVVGSLALVGLVIGIVIVNLYVILAVLGLVIMLFFISKGMDASRIDEVHVTNWD